MSLDARIVNAAAERGVPANRLRRHLVFQRMLCRFAADGSWVLKGGFCLEVRFDLSSRATKDLDVAVSDVIRDAAEMRELVEEALATDMADGFSFQVRPAAELPLSDAGTRTWRMKVDALVGASSFDTVTLDVSTAFSELSGATEPLVVPPAVTHDALGPCTMDAVDVNQHAAEKFHAMARTYAGGRPSSRVKDLVDITLLQEAGVVDPAALGARLVLVYTARDDSRPPLEMPPVPAAWSEDYPRLAAEAGLDADELDIAVSIAHELYREAMASLIDEER